VVDIESYPHCELRRPARKPIADAVEEIAKRLGVVPMEAWTKLREALTVSDIKAYWRSSLDPRHNPIASDRWPRAHIEIAKQTVIFRDGERMTLVDLGRDAYEAWLDTIAAPQVALPAKVKEKPTKRGRKPVFEWPAIKKQCFEILDQDGAINPQIDPGWNQAKLERELLEWCSDKWDMSPASSTLREKLPKWITEWRATR